MKKGIVGTLVTLSMLSGTCVSLAAPTNLFSDVPAGNWAYDAVIQLSQAGIIEGYDNGKFMGDKTMTRYEMAQVVAKAMKKREKADANSKLALDKLAAEYASDLQKLGTRVSNLEKKADNIVITGEARIRYSADTLRNNVAGGANTTTTESKVRTRINFKGLISEEWQYKFRFQNEQNLNSSGGETTIEGNEAYILGPVGPTKVAFGRMDYLPAYGLLTDSTFDGIKVSFGNQVKVNIYAGKEFKNGLVADGSVKYPVSTDPTNVIGQSITAASGSGKTSVTGMDLSYALDAKTNIRAAYFQYSAVEAPIGVTVKDARMAELGFERKIAPDWMFQGVVSRSNASRDNTAYLAGVTYKEYDLKKVNSYNIYANYRNMGRLATWDSTYNMANIIAGGDVHGAKGVEIGFNIVPFKNSVLNVYYINGKATDNTQWSDKQFRAQMSMYM